MHMMSGRMSIIRRTIRMNIPHQSARSIARSRMIGRVVVVDFPPSTSPCFSSSFSRCTGFFAGGISSCDIAGNFSYCYFPRSLFIIACASRSDRNSSANCFFNEAMTQSRTACVCAGISSQFSSNSVSNNSLITIGLLGGKLWLSMRRITILLSSCFVIFHLFNVRIERIKKNQEADYNKSDLLTNPAAQAYPFSATAKSVARGRSLIWSGEEPQSYFERLFLCVGVLSLWVAKQREPKGSPVLHRSSNLCFGCPPVSKLAGDSQSLMERIMRTKSTITSATPKARSRRKPNPTTIYPLSQYEIKHRTHARAFRELTEFIEALTKAEKQVIGHVKPFGDPVTGLKEIRRLLGESIAKCKVIPFPAIKQQVEA